MVLFPVALVLWFLWIAFKEVQQILIHRVKKSQMADLAFFCLQGSQFSFKMASDVWLKLFEVVQVVYASWCTLALRAVMLVQ